MDLKEIEIKGSYYKTGFLLGNYHKKILKKFEQQVINNLNVDYEKIRKYEKCIKKFEFLMEELNGYCEGAEISFENLLKLKLFDFSLPKLSCTSLFLSSEFFEEGIPVCVKIRDKLPLPQYICKKTNENRVPCFFSGSISDIGWSFFVKENGFTGINNTGSNLKQKYINDAGFDDCDLTRIICEECNEPEEAIEIIKKMQKDGLVGCSGKNRGMIFLFAKGEKAILIEINSFKLNWKKIDGKFGFTNDFLVEGSEEWIEYIEGEGSKSSKMRKKRIDEILDENEKFNEEKLIEISRDKKNYPYSICRDTSLMPVRTVASYFVFLTEEPISWVCCGNPYVSPYFPFYIKGNKIIENFVSGEISLNLNLLFEKKGLNDEDYLNKIRKFEKKIKEKFKNITEHERKNIEIQKEVYGFIKKETI